MKLSDVIGKMFRKKQEKVLKGLPERFKACCWYEPREDPNGRIWVGVDGSKLYPIMLEYVQGLLKEKTLPRNPYLIGLFRQAESLPAAAWVNANTHWDVIGKDELRYRTLELLRLWFTEELHEAVGQAIGIHFIRTEDRKFLI